MRIEIGKAYCDEETIHSAAFSMNSEEVGVFDKFSAMGANYEALAGNLDTTSPEFLDMTRRVGYFLEGHVSWCRELELVKEDVELLSGLLSKGVLVDLCASRSGLVSFNTVRPHPLPLIVERGFQVARASFLLTRPQAEANLGDYPLTSCNIFVTSVFSIFQ